jgi:bifunctional non-homologous end joining protein LigD
VGDSGYIGRDMLCSASSTGLGFIKPELPTRVPEPPTGAGWFHEIKYDGYRTLIVIDRGQVRAFTRNGNDWTRAYRRWSMLAASWPAKRP